MIFFMIVFNNFYIWILIRKLYNKLSIIIDFKIVFIILFN